MQAEFDHLVVAADRLERGIAHVEKTLGVSCQTGGRHPRMHTHNALVGLGPGRYLEIIAIDPDAPPPESPRWFGLDDPIVRATLAKQPRLLTWVARTPDIQAALAASIHEPGPVRHMQRGELQWQIAFPQDGHLIEAGLVPPLIEWPADAQHPADRLPDSGLSLAEFHAAHPDPARVNVALEPLGLGQMLQLERDGSMNGARLRAAIDTPHGRRWLT